MVTLTGNHIKKSKAKRRSYAPQAKGADMKKVLIILCVVAVLALTACGKGDGTEKESTDKQEVVSEEEKKLRKEDEDMAEEVRRTVEIAGASLEVFDDLQKAIGNSTSSVEILSWGVSGITYIADVPNLKAEMDDVYKQMVNNGVFQSAKYKSMKYVVSVKKSNGQFVFSGEWK